VSPVPRTLVRRLLDTKLGRSLVSVAAVERPDVLLGALGWSVSRDCRFRNLAEWPRSLSGFEDVAPLVHSSNAANRGLAAMSLVETAHLWRLAADTSTDQVIEIGRERGGSTFVLGVALGGRGRLVSFDPQSKLGSAAFDDELRAALERYDIRNVDLRLEDSHAAELPEGEYSLVLIDGDPTYEGTKRDFERFCRRLRRGGHALFHDATAGGPRTRQLAPLMEEIEADPEFERQPDVGTFAHFVRTIET
jgi:predicted O-methyltransferase YrrM